MKFRRLNPYEQILVRAFRAREDRILRRARIQNGCHPDYQNGGKRHPGVTLGEWEKKD